MFFKSHLKALGLSQRISVLYLLLSLSSLCCFLLCFVYFNVTENRKSEQIDLVDSINSLKASVQLKLLADENESRKNAFQNLVEESTDRLRLQYCVLVGTDGTAIAHSNHDLISRKHLDPLGANLMVGDVKITKYQMGEHSLTEFNCPIHNKELECSVRFGILNRTLTQELQTAFQLFPLAVLFPFGMLLSGAILIKRCTRSAQRIQSQLEKTVGSDFINAHTLESIEVTDGAAFGWNRIVQHLKEYSTPDAISKKINLVTSGPENHTKSALDSIVDGIIETDEEGRVCFANVASSILLDQSDPESMGNELVDKFFSFASEDTNDELFNLNNLRRPVVVEIEKQDHGQSQFLRVERNPIRQNGKRTQKFGQIFTIRDITQQTLANASRGSFLDSASHELRTPLSNIQAYAETLADSETLDIEDQKEFCNIINSEVTRLSRLVDDLLSVSSIESGSLAVQYQNVESARMIDAIIEKVQPQVQKKKIEFSVSLAEKLPELELDKDKFMTAIINIVGNAVKYTPHEGRVGLSVDVVKDQLVIKVEDSGYGIAEEELPKIFEKFFRSDDERVHDENGSGLGLAFSREIVELHGGNIDVTSVLNSGSCFTISVPIRRDAK